MKTRLEELNRLIKNFEELARSYPEAGFENYIAKFKKERAELVSTIGKKK